MGAGNPGFKFQDKAYNRKYPGAEYAYPTTFFFDYRSDEDDEEDIYHEDDFADEVDYLANASGMKNIYGMEGDEDSDCCMGHGRAIVVAEGDHARLVVQDGDNGRIAFTIIPSYSYDDVYEDVFNENERCSCPMTRDEIEDEVDKVWAGIMEKYRLEANDVFSCIHSAFPAEGALSYRSSAWTSSQLPAYVPDKQIITF